MQTRAGEHAAHAWTLNNHAVFLAHHKQTARALTLLTRAQAEAPHDARIQVTIGNVRWDLGDLDAARAAYRRALAVSPDEVTAHYNLALLHEEQGDVAAARGELERVLVLQPQDAAREDLTRLSQDSPSHS
jgi:Flp pilus assembly protein TadD